MTRYMTSYMTYILFIGIHTLLHNVTPVTDTTPPDEAGCLGKQMMLG